MAVLQNVTNQSTIDSSVATGVHVDSTLLGQGAGASLTTGTTATLIGYYAGNATTASIGNTFVGANCGSGILTSREHTAVGYNALTGVVSASPTQYYNCAFGFESLQNATGGRNSAYGGVSGASLLSGNNNCLFGFDVGSNYTSSESNNICIGSGVTGTATENTTTRIGNAQTACYISGIENVSQTAAVVTVTSSGQLGAAAGIITAPVSSNTATIGFGTSLTAGTSVQNTLGYDILLNISVAVTMAVGATIVLGVGTTSTPTTNTVIASTSVAAVYNFCAIVPNNYYVLVNTAGTIVIGSITVQVCPL